MTEEKKSFKSLNHQIRQIRRVCMLYYQKGRLLWLTRTNIRHYTSLLLIKKHPHSRYRTVLVFPQSYTTSPTPATSAPRFLRVSICTLKITLSSIVMVLKYQKQAVQSQGQIYTNNKLIYVNIFVYTSKRGLQSWIFNLQPWGKTLIDFFNVHTYTYKQ